MQRKRSFGRFVIYGVIIVTGLYVFLCVGLTLLQRKLLYFPCKSSLANSEKAAAACGFEAWHNGGGQFIGWKRPGKIVPSQGKVLILHGNAGCALDRVTYADGLQSIAALDVYIVEFPGYDGRRGSPSQDSLFDAGREAMQQLGNQCNILLVGESLGTGLAAYLAGAYATQIAGVFLVAPYNNLAAVAQDHLPIFPVKLMLRDKFTSDAHLKSFHGPLAVLLAGKDDVVPNRFGRALYEGYQGPKKLWEFPHAGHNDLSQPTAEFWKEVLGFLRQ